MYMCVTACTHNVSRHGLSIIMRAEMRIDIHIGTNIEICMKLLYRHVYRDVYRHVYRHKDAFLRRLSKQGRYSHRSLYSYGLYSYGQGVSPFGEGRQHKRAILIAAVIALVQNRHPYLYTDSRKPKRDGHPCLSGYTGSLVWASAQADIQTGVLYRHMCRHV